MDEALWAARPDLVLTGRTLMGHESAKNQQLEDHYFGAIPERVIEFMRDLEYESLRLGIPVKTRHNEVAPNQFELAPIYEEANLANDHNQLLMTIMNKIARRHNFRILLHEKPFKGVNGSGKHNNWSLGTDTGVNLLGPGKTPSENLQFITFLVNVMAAVYRHNGLLKASIMSATNAHRLGANEAPPAIISTFLGAQISAVLEKLEASRSDAAITFSAKNMFKMSGISHIPTLMLDNTDRNRTSPFAFTGNRFEFRAVGSSDNCADAMLTLNTAVAEQLTRFKEAVDRHIESGMKKEKAIYEELKKLIRECKPIHFDGNGYSDEWKAEAARRGLDCETSTPLIFDRYLTPDSIRMFESTGVLNKVEIEARTEVKWETYTKKIQIEGRVLGDLTMNHIVPIASRYEAMLLDKVYKMAQIGGLDASADIDLLKKIQGHTAAIQTLTIEMIEARKKANRIENARAKAIAYHDTVEVYFEEIRRHIDKLEEIIDDQMWTARACCIGLFPRRFFLQPTPPEQPRHNEPLPMPASDSVRRTFRNLPAPLCEVDLSFSRTLRIRQNVLRAAEAEEDRCNMPVRRNRRGVFGQTDPIIRDFFLHLFEYFRPVRAEPPENRASHRKRNPVNSRPKR